MQIIQQMGAFGIEQASLPDSSIEQRTFDPKTGLVTSIKTNIGSVKIQDLTYQWRSNGSLESRINNKTGTPITDTFAYDNLDRLTSTQTATSGTTQRTLTQTYNNLGNIKSNASTQISDTQVSGYQYGTTLNAGPHATSAVTINGIAYSLSYDKNGAVEVYDAAGTNPDKFIAYNAANQPTRITVGTSLNDANPIARDEFRYTPDGARYYKKSTYKEGSRVRTDFTFYIDGYETTYFDAFSTLKQTEKTQVGDALLSVRKTPYSGLVSEILQVVHRDHLGSVDVVVNSVSNTVSMAFEPFGTRRSTSLVSNITTTEMTNLLAKNDVLNSQGYTGHESLDRTGLIHMRGRVYDPQLGRFLSPDPLVQSPTNSQSWNRYSYVLNNPLRYTDPTGFETETITVTASPYNPSKPPICEGCTYQSKDFLDSMRNNTSSFTPPVVADKTNTLTGAQDNNPQQANSCESATSVSCALKETAQGPGTEFDTKDEAAIDGLQYASENPIYDSHGKLVEQGGDITKTEHGYTYNDIQNGKTGKVDVKISSNAVGWFHTHPRTGNKALDETNRKLSDEDISSHRKLSSLRGADFSTYLGGADGAIRVYKSGELTSTTIKPAGFLSL